MERAVFDDSAPDDPTVHDGLSRRRGEANDGETAERAAAQTPSERDGGADAAGSPRSFGRTQAIDPVADEAGWEAATFLSESLDSFHSETSPAFRRGGAGSDLGDDPALFGDVLARQGRGWSGAISAAAVLVILVAVGLPVGRWLLEPRLPQVVTGTLVIVTNPPGAIAIIDGSPGGTTPVNHKVAVGSHTIELRGAGPSRTLAVNIAAGEQAFQYVELPGATAVVGQLDVSSDPSGAFVTIDGIARGTTPTVAHLSPGEHTVMLTSERGWAAQTVSITSGVSASMVVAATSWSRVTP